MAYLPGVFKMKGRLTSYTLEHQENCSPEKEAFLSPIQPSSSRFKHFAYIENRRRRTRFIPIVIMDHEKLERLKERAWTVDIPKAEEHLAFLKGEIQKLEESMSSLAGDRLLAAEGYLKYFKHEFAQTEAELDLRIQSQLAFAKIINVAQKASRTGNLPRSEILQALNDVGQVATKRDHRYTEQSRLMTQGIRQKWPRGNIAAQTRLVRTVAPWFLRRWFLAKPHYLLLRFIIAVVKKGTN